LVVTAAHCLEFSTGGELMLGWDNVFCQIEPANHQGLPCAAKFTDPVADVAVLGEVDGQEYWRE
jgi:hypothetical protein